MKLILDIARAVRIAHKLKNQPIDVRTDGYKLYYSPWDDASQIKYNFARFKISQCPRLQKLLVWLDWI